jgi:ribosomal protein S16
VLIFFVVLPKKLLHSSLQVGTFDPTKKKKKKKKVRIQDDEETGENIEKVTEKVETLAVADGMDSAFLGLKKKKKKKPVRSTKFWTFLVHTCFSSVCRFFLFQLLVLAM